MASSAAAPCGSGWDRGFEEAAALPWNLADALSPLAIGCRGAGLSSTARLMHLRTQWNRFGAFRVITA
jgi:hypothetical protein